MDKPTSGLLAHGGSENYNRGPIRCACLDLSTGEVLFDEDYNKNHREDMDHGSCQDAATIAILSAIIKAHELDIKPVIYCTNPEAIKRVEGFLQWYVEGEPPYESFDKEWHPLILKAMKPIDFDVKDVELHLWKKKEFGVSPLAKGRWG